MNIHDVIKNLRDLINIQPTLPCWVIQDSEGNAHYPITSTDINTFVGSTHVFLRTSEPSSDCAGSAMSVNDLCLRLSQYDDTLPVVIETEPRIIECKKLDYMSYQKADPDYELEMAHILFEPIR